MIRVLLLVTIFLSGCASAPKGSLSFDEVNIPEPSSDLSILVFYRLISPPACCDMRVSINDEQVTALPNYSFSYVALKPGSHNLKVSWNPMMLTPSKTRVISIEPNTTKYVQLNSSVYTPMGIQLGSDRNAEQSEKLATSKLKECCKFIDSKNSNKSKQQGLSGGTR